jgi:hypothetical protein
VGGTYVVLTLTTAGVAPGSYTLSLTNHPLGPTQLFVNELDEFGNPTGELFDANATLFDGTLTVIPEPGAITLTCIALTALVAVTLRRQFG